MCERERERERDAVSLYSLQVVHTNFSWCYFLSDLSDPEYPQPSGLFSVFLLIFNSAVVWMVSILLFTSSSLVPFSRDTNDNWQLHTP